MSDQYVEAVRNQMEHVAASMRVDRTGWTDDQWIADARQLMGDIEGSVLDLLNGHVMAMLRRLDELPDGDLYALCPDCNGTGQANHYPNFPDQCATCSTGFVLVERGNP